LSPGAQELYDQLLALRPHARKNAAANAAPIGAKPRSSSKKTKNGSDPAQAVGAPVGLT
jgi:hypothetical protein